MNPFLGADSAVRSLNRARIVALPGVSVDEGILGQSGYALLAAETLQTEVAAAASALGLEPDASDLLPQFYRLFEIETVSPLAISLARRYGRRLGFLLLMLRRGGAANRAARPSLYLSIEKGLMDTFGEWVRRPGVGA